MSTSEQLTPGTPDKDLHEGTSGEFPIDMPAVDTEPFGESDAPRAAGFFSVIRAHRIFTRRFNVSGVSRFHAVMVSLTEVFPSGGGALDVPGIGPATMKVYNVAPRDGGQVDVRGEIDWPSDLNIRVSFWVS